ncbi:hypothetical protein MLD38_009983 [Melastoma candidum]|uniref:Uncharacterized protein n=1 Tax=Melastoma candidum TaxID=119954 RepID=A0ACB9QXK7_9MYRT|nr:hypothetical protein MLD38_009983 [Melastoma candidum]
MTPNSCLCFTSVGPDSGFLGQNSCVFKIKKIGRPASPRRLIRVCKNRLTGNVREDVFAVVVFGDGKVGRRWDVGLTPGSEQPPCRHLVMVGSEGLASSGRRRTDRWQRGITLGFTGTEQQQGRHLDAVVVGQPLVSTEGRPPQLGRMVVASEFGAEGRDMQLGGRDCRSLWNVVLIFYS